MYGVELGQMGHTGRIGSDFVDVNDGEPQFGSIENRPQSQTPHAAKAVDADSNGHVFLIIG